MVIFTFILLTHEHNMSFHFLVFLNPPLLTRDLFTALHLISVYGYLYCSPSSVFGSLQCSPSLPIQYLPSALTLFFLNISALSPSSLSLDLPSALLNHCGWISPLISTFSPSLVFPTAPWFLFFLFLCISHILPSSLSLDHCSHYSVCLLISLLFSLISLSLGLSVVIPFLCLRISTLPFFCLMISHCNPSNLWLWP